MLFVVFFATLLALVILAGYLLTRNSHRDAVAELEGLDPGVANFDDLATIEERLNPRPERTLADYERTTDEYLKALRDDEPEGDIVKDPMRKVPPMGFNPRADA